NCRRMLVSHHPRPTVLTVGDGATIILTNKKRVEWTFAKNFRTSFLAERSAQQWEGRAMSSASFCRKSLTFVVLSVASLFGCITLAHAQNGKFTDWGWPLPYEKVSDKSVAWLKQKGWWPLQVAFQSPWSGQNNISIVIDKEGLLTKRGIEMKLTPFGSGPATNEVLVSGKVQVASAGNFPYTSLLDKEIPVKTIANITP